MSAARMPRPGTRSTCAQCGRTVWLRLAGTAGYTTEHPGAEVFQWRGRKGSKHYRDCPGRPGRPWTAHQPASMKPVYYRPTTREDVE